MAVLNWYEKFRSTLKNITQVEEQTWNWLPPWGPQTFRYLVCGRAGSGKTTAVLDILLRGMKWDRIILCTANPYEELYTYLTNICEELQVKREGLIAKGWEPISDHPILEIYESIEDLPSVQSLDDIDAKKIVIIDDFISETNKERWAKIRNYALLGRKVNCGVFYLSQNYYQKRDEFRELKKNCNQFILFKSSSRSDRNIIKEQIPYISDEQIRWLMSKWYATTHNFLYIDTTKPAEEQVLLNYNTVDFDNMEIGESLVKENKNKNKHKKK